jgi:hypothetical protein
VSESIETLIDRLPERQRYEFALRCARRVQHLMRDPRSVASLDTRERWLRGEATTEEMNAAAAAADVAAWAETQYAARAASEAAALASDGDAPNAASAARDAANAEWAAERAWQRAELKRMLAEGGGDGK